MYNVIEPWMETASDSDKRHICKLAKICGSGKGVHVETRDPTTINVFGKTTPLMHKHQTLDRSQSDLFEKQTKDDAINKPLARRRRHFDNYETSHSGASVANYFQLNQKPMKKQPYSRVLTASAQDKLEKWQNYANHKEFQTRAQVIESLRNLDRAVTTLPTYTEHLLNNPKLEKSGRGNALFAYSKKRNYVGPLRRVATAPVEIEPPGEDPEIARIFQPGGYRVELQDSGNVQFLKNKTRSTTCKVVMMGGSGVMQSTMHSAFPNWCATE
jgi:hypothetical protein